MSQIKSLLEEKFGDFGVGAIYSTVKVIYLNEITKLAIIGVRHAHFSKFQQIIAEWRRIGDQTVAVQCLHVSGTIKSSERKLARLQRRRLTGAVKSARSDAQREQIREMLRECDRMVDSLRFESCRRRIIEQRIGKLGQNVARSQPQISDDSSESDE